ncbi:MULTISPECIES: serine hydrolase [unclassified Streptomyces]|uniref:serine hydrolase n=1 Tax=unclassified Streptomyces TaxID=2593676 RepID=UPI002E80D7FA|nr:serine hydrolase [Streptomyces sp. NBC_00589]WTI38458.1 serine hydrolase [Streptomyces sp. NBC_00775]WUB27864.1 serine hydrolase [Streptomyces sp. NBC_00589]
MFSTKALAAAEGSLKQAEGTSAPEDASSDGGASSGSGKSGPESDSRLRAAVAAWVAGADGDESAAAGRDGGNSAAGRPGTDTATEGTDDVADAADAADAADEESTEPVADVDADADAADAEGDRDSGVSDVASTADVDATADVVSGEARDTASGEASSAGEPEAKSASDTASAPAAEPKPKPEAEGGTSGKDAASGPKSTSEDSPKEPADASPEDSPKEPSKAASAPAKGSTDSKDSAPAKDSASVKDSAPAKDPVDTGDSKDSKASVDAKASADRETPADAKDPVDPRGSAVAKGSTDAKASAAAETPADAKASAAAKTPADAKASAAAETPADVKDSAPAETPADVKDSTPEPPVDQPTAVFKAPRPPAVDQPTTMLKLGGATKPPTAKPAGESTAKPASKPDPTAKPAGESTAKPASKPDPTAKPESDPERTSKFVALKPLDAAAPAKPKAPAGPASTPADATAALPQVGPERTTQQPLPPKPPLDLLAELTNTPPPPQTPVRTVVRRVKIWTPLVLLLAVVFAVVQAVRPLPAPALALTADETYTFDGGTLDLPWPGQGQSAIEVEGVGSLGTEGKQSPAPIASVAKIMTAYVILQEHPLKGNEGGEKITVDQQAEDESKLPDESTAAMSKGQQFTERQMLQMLMIPSGNNAARLLARWDSDNKTFVAKMNAAAKKLGMTKSAYTDPSGLEKTTVSTATDQLKLAKAVMQDEVFRGIVGMASAKIPGLDSTIYNNNDLLVKQVGVIGLKTGSSTPAGGNLVWAATKTVNGKTQTVYGAVLNQNAGTGKVWDSLQLALTNSQKLIDKVQQSLISATVVKKGQVVGYVDDQLGGQTPVVATKNMTAVGWPGLKTKLSVGLVDGKAVPHSGKAGTVVGQLTVGDGSSHAVKIPVALQSDLTEPALGAKLTRVG